MPDMNTFYLLHLQIGHQNYYLTRFSVKCYNSKRTVFVFDCCSLNNLMEFTCYSDRLNDFSDSFLDVIRMSLSTVFFHTV